MESNVDCAIIAPNFIKNSLIIAPNFIKNNVIIAPNNKKIAIFAVQKQRLWDILSGK